MEDKGGQSRPPLQALSVGCADSSSRGRAKAVELAALSGRKTDTLRYPYTADERRGQRERRKDFR